MIAITGANGQLGRLVIQQLLVNHSPDQLIGLVRDPSRCEELSQLGIELRQADYDQPATLQKALVGVDKLLLISSSEVGKRSAQHAAVIEAAVAEKVSLLVYTSILHASENPMLLAEEHQHTEQAIQQSGLASVILRNGWYIENHLAALEHGLACGAIQGAAGEGKIFGAARADYAAAAVAVLTSAQTPVGQALELAGDSGYSMADFAACLSKLSDKPVEYQNLTAEDYTQGLMAAGLPEGFAAILADADVQAGHGWLAEKSQTLSTLIGRSTTSLEQVVSQALAR